MQYEKKLSDAISRVELELTQLGLEQPTQNPHLARLSAAWTDLLRAINLEPAPLTRTCPFCGAIVRRAATLCGHCWQKLDPLP